MRAAYVHAASLRMGYDGDTGASGAAITLALCGQWEHPPPCPLAAHHTATTRTSAQQNAAQQHGVQQDDMTLNLRTVFAAEPEQEGEVRRRIRAALAQGSQTGPEGTTSRWTLLADEAGELTAAERIHAERLAGT
ncbi:hypothetical protein SAMN04489743_0549 [Pseudarthrobacter equi]|uniref:Uncharacterized protein n=1 Tax=Pseudarthrobacter equi TaxID=728066 RepID=A0A1H1U098_9MICC|nr:hypothetical protein [Pseudarthrobacter equi]SDS65868.1 hypothetical protein SAMN04489743_0549 [Pseudarthrobacter equi]